VLFHTGIGLRVLVPSRLLGLFLLFLALVGARLYAGEVRVPSVALAGVPFEITASGFAPQTRVQIRFEDAQGRLLARADAVADESGDASLRVRIPQAGAVRYVWQAGAASGNGMLRVIPAWWSLLPPLLAIALALLLRQVALALVGGVWLGAWLVAGGEPFTPLLRVVDTYLLDAYADRDHLQIVLFTLLLGGMLGHHYPRGRATGDCARAESARALRPRRATERVPAGAANLHRRLRKHAVCRRDDAPAGRPLPRLARETGVPD
jgi:hypothetical protein